MALNQLYLDRPDLLMTSEQGRSTDVRSAHEFDLDLHEASGVERAQIGQMGVDRDNENLANAIMEAKRDRHRSEQR